MPILLYMKLYIMYIIILYYSFHIPILVNNADINFHNWNIFKIVVKYNSHHSSVAFIVHEGTWGCLLIIAEKKIQSPYVIFYTKCLAWNLTTKQTI